MPPQQSSPSGHPPDAPEPYLHPRRRRALLVWAVADTCLGLVLLLSPPSRVSTHAFDPAKSIAPMWAWGLVALTVGAVWLTVCLAIDRIRWPIAGYAIGLPAALLAGWHVFFVTSLVFAVENPVVALTGIPAYAGIAANHVLFAVDQV